MRQTPWEMAVDALSTMIQEHIRKGEDLPRPSKPRGWKYRIIPLAASQRVKAELYAAFRASRIKKLEFARLLGIPITTVDRLFDLRYRARLDQIEAAFALLGKRLAVEVQDAA
jgi:antitoxin HicB